MLSFRWSATRYVESSRKPWQKHEYRSEFFRKPFAEGEAKGEAKGRRHAILAVLAARQIAVSDVIRARIRACKDLPTLGRWLTCAATASTAEEVVKDVEAPRARRPRSR